MWLYPFLIVLVILAAAGGVLLGGVFTIVLVPIAAIAALSALLHMLWGRSLEGGAARDAQGTQRQPLPHARRRPSARALSSPEGLADTRRAQQ